MFVYSEWDGPSRDANGIMNFTLVFFVLVAVVVGQHWHSLLGLLQYTHWWSL